MRTRRRYLGHGSGFGGVKFVAAPGAVESANKLTWLRGELYLTTIRVRLVAAERVRMITKLFAADFGLV